MPSPSFRVSLCPCPVQRLDDHLFSLPDNRQLLAMGSSQSVLWDSPVACVRRKLKPLLLTDLKVHKLESLCTQIWPQYKLDTQNCWPEFRTFNFNVLSDLTNFLKQNGKWSEVPYIQAFWDLRSHPSLCKDCSTYQILLCSLSPSTTKECKSKAPKRPPKPSAPDFDQADELLPYRPGDETSRGETPPSSPSSSKPGSDDPKSPKEISTLSPSTRTQSKHMFPRREVTGPEGSTRVHVAFSISDMSQIEEKLRSFSENPTRYRKEFLRLTQAYHLTWNNLYYIIKCHFNL